MISYKLNVTFITFNYLVHLLLMDDRYMIVFFIKRYKLKYYPKVLEYSIFVYNEF